MELILLRTLYYYIFLLVILILLMDKILTLSVLHKLFLMNIFSHDSNLGFRFFFLIFSLFWWQNDINFGFSSLLKICQYLQTLLKDLRQLLDPF